MQTLLRERKRSRKPLSYRPSPPADVNLPYLIPIMNRKQKTVFIAMVLIWLINLILFLHFWFNPAHVVDGFKFVVNTLLIAWTVVMPGYFYFFLYRIRRVNPAIPIPTDWRVAMVVTKAPSEPFEVVKKTLLAMLFQNYPHDTWLADEAPDETTRRWCEIHGIRISTRHGVEAYHRENWPRRTKSKEGNLAYFYDMYGYEGYDFVVQLDADHVPGRDYLEDMLRPFVNPKVGYVSAPSICDSNAGNSWAARGRLFAESIMHGLLQAGYSYSFAPLCIGSHYAVRTRALKEIGGLGPELAEDHSTTLMMNAGGWKGVHAFDADASGEGPPTLADCMTQEFQWSRSLMIILLTLMPKYWKSLPLKLKFQFLFSQLWYPLFALTFLTGFLLPVIAVISGVPWVSVNFVQFLIHAVPVTLSIVAIVYFIRRMGWLKPAYSPFISWEVVLFQFVRWPWALWGCTMGVITALLGKSPAFKVTPKGHACKNELDWKLLIPYIAVICISFIPLFFEAEVHRAEGYNYFLIFHMLIYILTLFYILILHQKESRTNNVREAEVV